MSDQQTTIHLPSYLERELYDWLGTTRRLAWTVNFLLVLQFMFCLVCLVSVLLLYGGAILTILDMFKNLPGKI